MRRTLPSLIDRLSFAFWRGLALAVAGTLLLAAPARAADDAAVPLEDGVDASIEPGDDFFAYANGDWLKAARIPAGKGKWGAGSEITERTRQQLARLLDDAAIAPPGSDARKVADFRAAWLNEAAIEARGLAPLKPLLVGIDRIDSKAALTHHLGRTLRADVDPMNLGVYESQHLLGLAVQPGNHGETTHVAYLLQGGLGLPRDQVLGSDAGAQVRRAAYRAAVGEVLMKVDAVGGRVPSDIDRRAEAVLAFETALARSHASPEASANDHNADTLWTRADFARNAPGMDWTAFFASAGLARQPTFVAWQPGALTGAAALVAEQPLPAWKDYLRIRAIARHAEVLPKSIRASALTLRGLSADADAADARSQRALDAVQYAMGDAIGRLYVERHFPPASKARVQAIVADVVVAFRQRVDAATWLSPAAKATSQAKLKNLYFGVGYPERWSDTAGLAIDPADAAGNLRRVADRNYAQALARLGTPVEQTAWVIAPQWPGAVLTFHQNAYNFAAALLQPPKFDAAAPEAANYGAIGAIAGHEVTHFVDTLGADYEPDGHLRRWWTGDDQARYEAATEPLVRQFSAYRPFPDVAVDGKLGLTENLADLGGLVAAFDAHRRALGSRAADPAYVRAQDRRFFIGFARGWRATWRDDALRAQAGTDHAPERYRVSTVRNLDAWYEAFDVRPGQRLYLPPEARVRIW